MPVKRRTKVKPQWSGKQLRQFRRYLRRAITPYSETSAYESTSSNFTMEDTDQKDEGVTTNKKMKLHEARMIPGLTPGKVFGFPNTIITKLRYATSCQTTGTTGAAGRYVFSANGLFDPDITSTGHQPLYYDNYTSIYDQYVVLGSKITVEFMPRTAALNQIVGISGDDDQTFSANASTLREQNNSISTVAGPPGGEIPRLTMTFEPQEMFGVNAKADGGSQTPTTQNPNEEFCYCVWAYAADGVSSVTTDYSIMIEYTVKFSELKTPTQN